MSQYKEFEVKEIVWARVQGQLAWPAKIVKKLAHDHKTVYKVNFFGDPTYCYLHQESLSLFDGIQSESLALYQNDEKVKRAIELATLSSCRQQGDKLRILGQSNSLNIKVPNEHIATEQTRVSSKEHIDYQQKALQSSMGFGPQIFVDGFAMGSVTSENVVEMLESYRAERSAEMRGNLKRKQIISFQNQLKQNLLLKYNLHTLDLLKPYELQPVEVNFQLTQQRISRKQKKRADPVKFSEKQLCTRKLQRLLIQKGLNISQSHSLSNRIITQLSNRFSTSITFRQAFVRGYHQISCTTLPFIDEIQVEYLERQMLSVVDFQLGQNKMEEGSRMTQMHEDFAI